jgi:hypothetical protein
MNSDRIIVFAQLFSEEKTTLYSIHQFWRARFDNTSPYATTKPCMLNYNFQIQASQDDDDDGCQFVFVSYCNALL